jgi:ABC-type sulfate/molybdate transport systems ATPase subunit
MLSVELRHPLRAFELDLAFEVGQGECLALAGPSGAGKTSALRAVAGLLRAERAAVRCNGEVWDGPGVHVAPERRGCGFLFQEYALFDHMTAWENVAYGIRGRRAARRAQAIALLERFGADSLATARPRDLSGGERQRLALEVVLGGGPCAVVCLDEPTRGMDRSLKEALAARVADLADAGAAVLVATHDPEFAAQVAERVVLMGEGVVIADGPVAEILSGGWYFATEVARVLGGAGGALTPEQGLALLRTELVS